MVPAGLYQLCEPAFLYLIISLAIIIMVALQNVGTGYNYCVGTYSCSTSGVTGLFVIKILYILVWTWILNLLCKNGYEPLSWVLVLIPLVLMFIFMASFILHQYDISRLFNISELVASLYK